MPTDLKPGKDLKTLLENALRLMAEGESKAEAMAHALNVAGFRPASSSPAKKQAPPSSPPQRRGARRTNC